MSVWLRAGGKTAVFPVAVSLASEIGNWALALPHARECVQSPRDRPCREEGSSPGLRQRKRNLKSKYPKKQNRGGSMCVSLQNNELSSRNADSQSWGTQSEGKRPSKLLQSHPVFY